MAEIRWIKTSLVLILVLQFTAAATGQRVISIAVRDGDEVTLSCNNVIDGQKKCDSTEWYFTNSRSRTAVDLVRDGKIVEAAKDKSDRVSVSENCALVIKKVTDEDVGLYDCTQFRSGRVEDGRVDLSVVTMTEHKDNDEVTFNCSVSTSEGCGRTVKWLFHGQDVDRDDKDIKTSETSCSTSLKVVTYHYTYTLRFNSLTCEVTDGDKVQKFPFRISPSGDETGEDTTITTTTTTTTTTSSTTEDTQAAKTTTTSAISDDSKEIQSWWRFIFVSVGLAALIIIVVAVNMWTRIKGKKTQMDEVAVRYDGEDEAVNYENITPADGV